MNSNNSKKAQKNKKWQPFKYFFYDFVKFTGAIPAFIMVRPKFIYENASAKKHVKGGAMVICNHTTFMDPIIVHCALWYRRLNFLAAKEVFKSDLSKWFFRNMHCITVDRENFNYSTYKTIVERLKQNKLVVIFPEGHIEDKEAKLQSFKSGAAMMACMAGVPVVPYYVAPKKSKWSRTCVVVGEPITPEHSDSPMPDMTSVDSFNTSLQKKEDELSKIYLKYKKEKNDD